MTKIAVFGATSLVAQEYCRLAAARGDELFVVGRSVDKLDALVKDLGVRGAKVGSRAADLTRLDDHERLVDEAAQALGGIDCALIAHGVLPDQRAAERDFAVVERTILTNYTSVVSLCERLARHMEPRRRGTIAVIGSVAGDRGRRSVYVYGSTKAALHTYLAGLTDRLKLSGVDVVTIKPGLIDTPMTAHLPKSPLFASSATVARGIDRAIRRRQRVAYVPWIWRWIMLAVRSIPGAIFARMNL